MIDPAGFGQAPGECAEWELMDGGSKNVTVADICAFFGVPLPLPIEPGHVMKRSTYERLVREQQK